MMPQRVLTYWLTEVKPIPQQIVGQFGLERGRPHGGARYAMKCASLQSPPSAGTSRSGAMSNGLKKPPYPLRVIIHLRVSIMKRLLSRVCKYKPWTLKPGRSTAPDGFSRSLVRDLIWQCQLSLRMLSGLAQEPTEDLPPARRPALYRGCAFAARTAIVQNSLLFIRPSR